MQVKPLSWRIFCSRSGNRIAETPFGDYVLQFENGQWVLYYPHSEDKAWAFDDLEPALAMAQEDVTQRIKKMVQDPRRTIVIYTINSSNPRAKKWYRVAEACAFDGQLYLHRDCINDGVEHSRQVSGATPRTQADAIKMAKAHAADSGHPYVPGRYCGFFGLPLRKG